MNASERCKHMIRWPHECRDCEEEMRQKETATEDEVMTADQISTATLRGTARSFDASRWFVWARQLNDDADQIDAQAARIEALEAALLQAISQLEDDYKVTPLDGHAALIRKLQALAGGKAV